MAIPDFNENGRLPAGDWEATWDEVVEHLGTNFSRRQILDGLRHIVEQLLAHGVEDIWLDGSFVSDKYRPRDVDVVYAISPGADDADWADVGPSRRAHLKKYHKVDLWRQPSYQPPKTPGSTRLITIKEFFSSDSDDVPHGMVKLKMGSQEDDQEREATEGSEQQVAESDGDSAEH